MLLVCLNVFLLQMNSLVLINTEIIAYPVVVIGHYTTITTETSEICLVILFFFFLHKMRNVFLPLIVYMDL